MKNLIFAITLILSINIYSQNRFEKTKAFVRVYDLQGKKIGKGKILSISDTSLQLNRKVASAEIPVNSIGSIKTKRSAGHNVLKGAVIGASTMAILGAATANPDDWFLAYSAGEGVAVGAVFGGAGGAAIGGITILFKNSKSYEINGDLKKWKAFNEIIIK
ncbi:MAG: hypothetical protein GZ086_01800 [Gelidibacter sp.]|nr:hypothetical protein [Gelidibacter sp.]